MKWFRWICLCGVLTNLIAWGLPDSLRPYHIRHWLDDYKVELVEQTSEYGLGRKGLVRGRFSIQYAEGDRFQIDHLRHDWYDNIQQSKKPWPVDASILQYDEWGPSHLVRPDGIEVVEVGQIWTLPYSLGALVCAMPLIVWAIFRSLNHRACTSTV